MTATGATTDVPLRTTLSELVTALWFDIDHHGGAGAAGFFTADAELTFSQRTFRGVHAIDRVYRERAARGPRVSRHVTSNLHVVHEEPAFVEAVSVLVLYAQDGEAPAPATTPVLVADVSDRFVRIDDTTGGATGTWRIAARRIEHLFIAPGDVLAVPTA